MDDTTIVGSPSPSSAKKHQLNFQTDSIPTISQNIDSKQADPKSVHKKAIASVEDRKLAIQKKILNDELTKQAMFYKTNINQLQQANKIMKSYHKEEKVLNLIQKWRAVSQAGMSYIMNSTLIKISRIGGYEELRRKELEAEKAKLEYQIDDNLQEQMNEVLESNEFQMLPQEAQQEYKEKMEEKMSEAEIWKEKEFSKLDNRMKEIGNQELTMEELSKRLNMEYYLIFPE